MGSSEEREAGLEHVDFDRFSAVAEKGKGEKENEQDERTKYM